MKLFEMEGFLRGKCLPGDMKVNETHAEYLVRKFTELEQKLAESQREFRAADATIENLQMQDEKLAAENAWLKSAAKETLAHWAAAEPGEMEQMMDKCMPSLRVAYCETPATDAFLAEVRAQGVDMLTANLQQLIDEGNFEGYEIGLIAGAVYTGADIAAQLRKGANHE